MQLHPQYLTLKESLLHEIAHWATYRMHGPWMALGPSEVSTDGHGDYWQESVSRIQARSLAPAKPPLRRPPCVVPRMCDPECMAGADPRGRPIQKLWCHRLSPPRRPVAHSMHSSRVLVLPVHIGWSGCRNDHGHPKPPGAPEAVKILCTRSAVPQLISDSLGRPSTRAIHCGSVRSRTMSGLASAR